MKLLEIVDYVKVHSEEELLSLGLQSYFETEESNLDVLKNRYAAHEFKRITEPLEYFENSIKDIKNNITEYEWLYSILADEQSKNVLEHMLTAKLKFDTTEIEKAFSMDQIYFDRKIWGDLENEYYVDCGAFRGDTIIQFTVNCPNFSKIYAFEAVPEVMKVCQSELQELTVVVPNSILFYTNAVSDKKKKLYFDVGMMQGESKVSSQGDVEVEAVALDEIITSTVSFIKMDIEGSELEAIRGAKRIIQEYTPKMAICIYHKCDDFWKIPKQIEEYNSNYRFLIRQHDCEVYSETVLYCIPIISLNHEISLKASSIKEQRFYYAMNKSKVFTTYEMERIYDYLNTRKWYLKILMHQNFEIHNLQSSYEQLQQWNSELESAKSWLENQNDNQIVELKNKDAYISDLLVAKEWLEQQSKEHEKYIAELVDAKQQLENQNEFKNKEVEVLGINNKALEQRISELENENAKLNYRLKILKEDAMIQKWIKVKKYQV